MDGEERKKPERRGPEYVHFEEVSGKRHRYDAWFKRIGIGLFLGLAIAAAAFYVRPPIVAYKNVSAIKNALAAHPNAKVTSRIFDVDGSLLEERVDIVQGQSWRGEFFGGRLVHVQTPLYNYQYEKEQNVYKGFFSAAGANHPLAMLDMNLSFFSSWGESRRLRLVSSNATEITYEFDLPGKRYRLITDAVNLPKKLLVFLFEETGMSKAAEVDFDFGYQIKPDEFTPQKQPGAAELDMGQATGGNGNGWDTIGHIENFGVPVTLASFDVSHTGTVYFVASTIPSVTMYVEDDKGTVYLNNFAMRQWAIPGSQTVPRHIGNSFTPLDMGQWTPRTYKLRFFTDLDPGPGAQMEEIGHLKIEVPKITCEAVPVKFLSGVADISMMLGSEITSEKTRATTLRNIRRDSNGRMVLPFNQTHLTTEAPTGVAAEEDLFRAIGHYKRMMRYALFHVPKSNQIRSSAWSQIYDVYRYSLGMSKEAKVALKRTEEAFVSVPVELRGETGLDEARTVLSEEGILDRIP